MNLAPKKVQEQNQKIQQQQQGNNQNNQKPIDPRLANIQLPTQNPIYQTNSMQNQQQQQSNNPYQNINLNTIKIDSKYKISDEQKQQQLQLGQKQSSQSSQVGQNDINPQLQEQSQITQQPKQENTDKKYQNQPMQQQQQINIGDQNQNNNKDNKNQGPSITTKVKAVANDGINFFKRGFGIIEKKYDASKETAAYKKMQEVKNQGVVKMGVVKQKLEGEFEQLDQKKKQFMTQQKDSMNVWVRTKMEFIIVELLRKGRPELKELIHDPYMCECVKNMIDDIIDELWPQVEEKVLHSLRMKYGEPIRWKEVKPENQCCLNLPWYYFRKWYLYTMHPYNKSFWYKARTFTFWFLICIQLVPIYSIQSFLFMLILLLIDKTDEYQLIKYIVNYKIMQFFAYGVIQGVIGYIMFFMCNTYNNHDTMEERKDCVINGPGSELSLLVDSIGFILQLVLCWVSFLCLPCTTKAKHQFKYIQEQKTQYADTPQKVSCCCCTLDKKNGGRLKGFLLYDFMMFILTIGILFFMVYYLEYDTEYQIRQTIFMLKIFYGLIQLPFLIFLLPQSTDILTSSTITGYDRYGKTAPREIIYSKEEWEKSDKKDKERKLKNKQQKLERERKEEMRKRASLEKKQKNNKQFQQKDDEFNINNKEINLNNQNNNQKQQQPNNQGKDEKDDLLALDVGEFMHE